MSIDILDIILGGALGTITSIVIGEPLLRKIVNGEFKKERELKRRYEYKKQIFKYLHEVKTPSTNKIKQEFFSNNKKYDVQEVYDLLKEMEFEGRIRSVTYDGIKIEGTLWTPLG